MAIWHGEVPDPVELTELGLNSLSGYLGIEILELGDDWLKGRMPVDRRTHQPFGRLHGGASVALAETLASIAGSLTVDRTSHSAVGMEINANHVRPAKGWLRLWCGKGRGDRPHDANLVDPYHGRAGPSGLPVPHDTRRHSRTAGLRGI